MAQNYTRQTYINDISLSLKCNIFLLEQSERIVLSEMHKPELLISNQQANT